MTEREHQWATPRRSPVLFCLPMKETKGAAGDGGQKGLREVGGRRGLSGRLSEDRVYTMGKVRIAIPKAVADQVIFDADMSCCVCRERGHHIHHIDEDPSNNDLNNLALLCFKHHDEVTATGGLARRLTPSLVAKYRDHWCREVKSRREREGVGKSLDDLYFRAAFDAQSCVEVRKLRPRIELAEWEHVPPLLDELAALVSPLATRARIEAIRCLSHLAIMTRHKMPVPIAEAVGDLAEECLDLKCFFLPGEEPPARISPLEEELFDYGLEIFGSLIHDGDKYLDNLLVVERGCQLFWKMMLHARCMRSELLQKAAEHRYEWHAGHRSADALRLMELYKELAASGQTWLPELPADLDIKLLQLRLRKSKEG
jgi:hypothetical protein